MGVSPWPQTVFRAVFELAVLEMDVGDPVRVLLFRNSMGDLPVARQKVSDVEVDAVVRWSTTSRVSQLSGRPNASGSVMLAWP